VHCRIAACPGQSFTAKDLGTLPNGFVSRCTAINSHGQAVGDSATNGLFQPRAFLLQHGALVDLGRLPGASFSEA
jgi:probable HAF family extracellular repeat protein